MPSRPRLARFRQPTFRFACKGEQRAPRIEARRIVVPVHVLHFRDRLDEERIVRVVRPQPVEQPEGFVHLLLLPRDRSRRSPEIRLRRAAVHRAPGRAASAAALRPCSVRQEHPSEELQRGRKNVGAEPVEADAERRPAATGRAPARARARPSPAWRPAPPRGRRRAARGKARAIRTCRRRTRRRPVSDRARPRLRPRRSPRRFATGTRRLSTCRPD